MAKTNLEILRDRFTKAGYTKKGRSAIMGWIAGGRDGKLQKQINEMDRLTFEAFFKGVVIPNSAILTRNMIKKFPDEAQKLSAKQVALAKMGDEWDGDKFRAVLGRKPRKVMIDGKEITRPARIGELKEQDYNNLTNEGLSDQEIEKYANQFREEEEQEFLKSQRELQEKTRKELEEKQRNEREFMAKNATDYLFEFEPDDSKFKRWEKILGNTALGTGIDIMLPELRAEYEQAIRDGRDPNWKKAVGKDFAFNTALAFTPIGVAKAIEKFGLKGAKKIAGNLAGNFGLLSFENILRQLSSDHYRFDPQSAMWAGGIGATLPAMLTGGVMMANKYAPFLQKYTRPILKRSKGLIETPEAREVEIFEQYADDVHNYMTHLANEKTSYNTRNAYDIVSERAQILADRMNKISGNEEYCSGDIMNLLQTKQGLKQLKNKLQAPTPDEYFAMDNERKSRYQSVFPEVVNEIKEGTLIPDRLSKSVDFVARMAEDFGGVVEPIREVYSGWGRMPSEELEQLMETDPMLVKGWGNGMKDVSPEMQSLYDEWLEKYKR